MVRVWARSTSGVIFVEILMKIRTGIQAGEGLGDVVANLTHITGLDRLAKTYEGVTGKPCGCDERQAALNRLSLPGVSLVKG